MDDGLGTSCYGVKVIVSDLTVINIHTTDANFLTVLISCNFSPCN